MTGPWPYELWRACSLVSRDAPIEAPGGGRRAISHRDCSGPKRPPPPAAFERMTMSDPVAPRFGGQRAPNLWPQAPETHPSNRWTWMADRPSNRIDRLGPGARDSRLLVAPERPERGTMHVHRQEGRKRSSSRLPPPPPAYKGLATWGANEVLSFFSRTDARG